jgi:hypothetical protein
VTGDLSKNTCLENVSVAPEFWLRRVPSMFFGKCVQVDERKEVGDSLFAEEWEKCAQVIENQEP